MGLEGLLYIYWSIENIFFAENQIKYDGSIVVPVRAYILKKNCLKLLLGTYLYLNIFHFYMFNIGICNLFFNRYLIIIRLSVLVI